MEGAILEGRTLGGRVREHRPGRRTEGTEARAASGGKRAAPHLATAATMTANATRRRPTRSIRTCHENGTACKQALIVPFNRPILCRGSVLYTARQQHDTPPIATPRTGAEHMMYCLQQQHLKLAQPHLATVHAFLAHRFKLRAAQTERACVLVRLGHCMGRVPGHTPCLPHLSEG